MKKVSELNREEKIELIRKLQAGEVHVIDGNIIELSPVIIYKGLSYDMAEKYWINGNEYTAGDFDNVIKLYPKDQTLMFLPAKHEEIEE